MIYFDATATTKPSQEVLDTYNKVNKEYWFNPSSMYNLSVICQNLIEQTSANIFKMLNLKDKFIYYTSGATEANNMAIMGLVKPYINQNKHIITTEIEHPSVYNTFKYLESIGFKVTYLKCKNGIINLDDLKASLTKDTILVSIMWVNNIIGSINPMKDIIEIVKKNSHAKLHSDMVQGFAKIKPDFAFNDIDLITITMHKLEGLKGIGLLISNKNLKLEPIIYGGHQQLALRPGTLDTGLIVSAAKTIRLALEKQDASYYYVQDLANYLKNKLNKLPFIIINAPSPLQSPYIVSISFTNIKGETVMHYLEKADIYVGIGSACNEKIQTLERTILAISLDKERANNMIRISLSTHNTKEDIDLLVNKLQELGSK